MVFDYSDYFESVFIFPIIIISIVTIDLLYLLYRSKRKGTKQISKIEVVLQIIGTVVLTFVSITQLRLGIIFDNENSSSSLTGEISNVSHIMLPPKYYMNGSRVWPKLVEIDGEEYYIMSIGDYEVGDKVVIEYLPNSQIVLLIDYSND
jgi:hypothetical protein